MSFGSKNITFRKDLSRLMFSEEMDRNLEILQKFLNKYEVGKQYYREEVVLIESGGTFQIGICNVPEDQLSKVSFDPAEWIIFSPDTLSSGDNSYLRPNPVNINLGGVKIGDTFNGTVQDALDKLLYPFIEATLTFSLSSPREKGIVQNITLTGTVTPNNDTINSIDIVSGGNTIHTSLSNNVSFVDTGVVATKSYSLRVSTNTSVKIASATVIFVAPSYYGVFVDGATENDIKSLSKNIFLKQNRTFNFAPNLERYYYAYPQSFGLLSKIIDQNGFDITSSFSYSVESFTLSDNSLENYYVYKSNADTTQSSFNITFEF